MHIYLAEPRKNGGGGAEQIYISVCVNENHIKWFRSD